MLKTVKVQVAEYKAIKAYCQKEGRYLQFVLSEAIRQYLADKSANSNKAA